MIVYNVKRRWFAKHDEAEQYRIWCGLKPKATRKIEITKREELVLLLTALCEATLQAVSDAKVAMPDVDVGGLVDEAYVRPGTEELPGWVPDFLVKDGKIKL